MDEIKKEDLENGYSDFLTVGEMKKFLEETKLPDNAKVLIQRVEDRYFEKNGWGIYLKDDPMSKYLTENQNLSEEQKNMYKNQYHPAWCCVKYNDDDFLFIDMHF